MECILPGGTFKIPSSRELAPKTPLNNGFTEPYMFAPEYIPKDPEHTFDDDILSDIPTGSLDIKEDLFVHMEEV